ncbi:MAG: hypothetical protein AABW91_03995 [Nanoarchaeota archaeon]
MLKKAEVIIVNNRRILNPTSINNPKTPYLKVFLEVPYATTKAMNSEYIATPVHSFATIKEIELTTISLFTMLTVPFPITKRKPLIIKTKKFMKKSVIGFRLKNQLNKRKTPRNCDILYGLKPHSVLDAY